MLQLIPQVAQGWAEQVHELHEKCPSFYEYIDALFAPANDKMT